MTEQLRREAEQLLAEEDAKAAERAKQEAANQEESRLQGALAKIKEQRRREAAELERKEASRQADALAAKRLELEDQAEARAITLRRQLEELRALDVEHRQALHRAGRPAPHSLNDSMVTLLGGWLRDRLHAHRLTDRAINPPFSSDPNQRSRTLSERDPLSRMETKEAS